MFADIMGYRHQCLESSLQALQAVHVPLAQAKAPGYIPSGFTDDEGIYYFVPALANHCGLSLDGAIHLFFGVLIAAAILTGLAGFGLLFRHPLARAVALAGAGFLALITFHVWDDYVAQMFTVWMALPLLLYFLKNPKIPFPAWCVFLGFTGMFCGYANFIRAQSGTGVLLAVFLFIALGVGFSLQRKAFLFILLAAFFTVPSLHFKMLEQKRDAFLVQMNPDYRPASISHTFWHTVYIGLGYVDNPYGIRYDDSVGDAKVKSIDPSVLYQTPRYQEILRGEVFRLIRTDPGFILRNLFFKGLKILGYLLLFMNLGIPAFFYARPSWRVTAPFAFLILFGALPGFVAVPAKPYLLGFISAAVVFGIYLIGMAVEKYFGQGMAIKA